MKKEAKKKIEKSKGRRDGAEGIFIPAGLLIGIGMGFAYNNVAAGTLIGLGAGFLVMAVIRLMKKR